MGLPQVSVTILEEGLVLLLEGLLVLELLGLALDALPHFVFLAQHGLQLLLVDLVVAARVTRGHWLTSRASNCGSGHCRQSGDLAF